MKDRLATLGTLVGFLVGTVFGSGSVWQWNNLQVETAQLQLEEAISLSELRSEISGLQFEIYEATMEFRRLNFDKGNVPGTDIGIAVEQLDKRLLLLFDDFEVKEARLAKLEDREPRSIELDFRGPGRPSF